MLPLFLTKSELSLAASPSAAIVILNWNGKHYLEQFLPSVLTTSYPHCRIVVADNGSTDDSLEFLEQHYPSIEIIQLEENFGFAKGYNEALKRVEADYYVLLNSDVEVTAGWLEPIIDLLESHENNAACQPKILAFKNKHFFEYAGASGGWLDAYGYPFARGRVFDICEEDQGQYDTTEEVFWASGAALVIKSKVFHQLNGFDEYFFAHQEEIDLCWRIQLTGYKLFCCPQSVVYHVGGGTLPRGNSNKTYLNFRNNQVMLWKNLPWKEKWWKVPYRQTLDQISALKGLVSGDGGYFIAIMKAHLVFTIWLFFGKKEKPYLNPKPIGKLSGVYNSNIVWQHFVKKKTRFSQIVKKKSR